MATIKLNKENFEKEVIQSDKPVIIDFWASWCRPCQMIGPIFEELSNDYEGKLKFAKLSTEEEAELASAHGVMSIPTMIIFKDGKEIERISGAMPKEMLKAEIDKRI